MSETGTEASEQQAQKMDTSSNTFAPPKYLSLALQAGNRTPANKKNARVVENKGTPKKHKSKRGANSGEALWRAPAAKRASHSLYLAQHDSSGR